MKIKNVVMMAGLALFMSSCTVMHTAVVTNNPVGDKVGVAKGHNFQKDVDISHKAAMENGGISKVGIAETKMTAILILVTTNHTVTGE